MKKIFLIISIIALLCCTACFAPNIPNQSFTKWQSENEEIVFYISEDSIIGTINLSEETIDVLISFDASNNMSFYPAELYYSDVLYDEIECWKCNFKKNKFIAVVELTTYFEVGQEFVFELVEENVNESEIPYPSKPETLPKTPDYDFPYPEN